MVGAIESQSDLQTAVRPHTMEISGAARTAIVRRTNSIILTNHTTVEAHNVFFAGRRSRSSIRQSGTDC